MASPTTSTTAGIELDPTELARAVWPEQARRFEALLEAEGTRACADVVRAARHQVLSDGKRLRAVLPLLVGRALAPGLEGTRADRALWSGLALELAHAGTLCHDDVIDEDRVRRDEPTVWVVHGVPQAINAGDLLFSLSPEALHQAPFPATVLVEALRDHAAALRGVFHGQAAETVLRRDRELPTVAAWEQIARAKTGALFAHGFALGGLCVDASPRQVSLLADVGERLGVIFQLQDDLLDLLGDKRRAEVACDLREGKPSWLVAVTAAACNARDANEFGRVLYRPRTEKTAADTAWLRETMEATRAPEKGLARLLEAYRELAATVRREVPVLLPAVRSIVRKIHAPLAHRVPLSELDS